jgi:hypothetical protein
MSILLKAAAGLFAGVNVGLLTFAFWPRIEPAVVTARPAVEQPTFVTGAVATKSALSMAAAIAAPAADKAAIDKLAFALRDGLVPADGASPTGALALMPITATSANANDAALRLRAQGLVALAGGDVAGARAFLERAAEGGDARALLVLGDTYDPATLARMGAVGLKGDAARARDYYARALTAGVAAGRDRMAALDAQQD